MISIAAVLAVIVTISGLFINTNVKAADLASVSPEMEQTQSNAFSERSRSATGATDKARMRLAREALAPNHAAPP